MVGVILQNPSNSHSLLPWNVIDPDVWVDTSTDWGVGVVYGHLWAAWRLELGWKSDSRDIGWVESVALKLSVLWLTHDRYMYCDITIHSDNTGVIGAFYSHTCNIPCNESLFHMASYTIPSNITIPPVYVSSTLNRADPLSHSIPGQPSLQIPEPLQLPAKLESFLSYV